MMFPHPPTTPQPTPRRNRAWIWIFVVLALLAIAAVASIIAYNLSLQLKPEQLAAARALWKQMEPRDYEFNYTTRRTGSDDLDRYLVRVRNRQVVHAELNGVALESRLLEYRGLSSLLADIKRFQDLDAQPGKPRTLTRAIFDEQTGQLRWYLRSVMASRERIAITVEKVQVLKVE